MESQKIINLLNNNDIKSQKLTTKEWYIINDQSYRKYSSILMMVVEIILLLNLTSK